jgi:hypothetical protein
VHHLTAAAAAAAADAERAHGQCMVPGSIAGLLSGVQRRQGQGALRDTHGQAQSVAAGAGEPTHTQHSECVDVRPNAC